MKVLIVDNSNVVTSYLSEEIETLGFSVAVCRKHAEVEARLVEGEEFFAAIVGIVLDDAPKGEIVDLTLFFNLPTIVLTGIDDKKFKATVYAKDIVDYVLKKSLDDLNYAISLVERLRENTQRTMLVVDDSKVSRMLISDYLTLHKFNVLEARDGVDALSIIEKRSDISMVITDYHMPKLDGFKLTRKLRENYSKEELPIIVISSDSGGEVISAFLRYGANDYIDKTLARNVFYSRVYLNLDNVTLLDRTKKLNAELNTINDYNVQEMTKAREKQKNIVVNDLENSKEWRVNTIYKPSDILSGDSWSIHTRQDGSILLYLIDAMGHGVLPSLTAFGLAANIRQYIDYTVTFEEFSSRILESLRGILGEDEQLSYSVFSFNPEMTEVEYSIGGMYPTYLKCNGEIKELKANYLPILNFTPSISTTKTSCEGLESLIVYSDGLVEEEFPELQGVTPQSILENPEQFEMLKGLFHDEKETDDDTTILFLERLSE